MGPASCDSCSSACVRNALVIAMVSIPLKIHSFNNHKTAHNNWKNCCWRRKQEK
jgi:hypothetical protein